MGNSQEPPNLPFKAPFFHSLEAKVLLQFFNRLTLYALLLGGLYLKLKEYQGRRSRVLSFSLFGGALGHSNKSNGRRELEGGEIKEKGLNYGNGGYTARGGGGGEREKELLFSVARATFLVKKAKSKTGRIDPELLGNCCNKCNKNVIPCLFVVLLLIVDSLLLWKKEKAIDNKHRAFMICWCKDNSLIPSPSVIALLARVACEHACVQIRKGIWYIILQSY